ncbi:hypothetical protein EBZ37_13665, partial [bacterium]|nr:hypothetical protein [bacterium]
MTRPFNHLLNGELCQWGTPSLHWSHEEQLSLWKEDYQQLAAALNKNKDATTKNKYASSLKFLKAAKVTSRECMIRDRDEDGRPIGDQRRVGYVEIMLTGKDAEYWNGDSTPPPAQEEWAMHICQPDLLPHFITGKWDSGRKYNEIFIFEVTDPGKPIDLNKEEAPYTSDNFVSSPRRLRAVLEDCARKCFGSQDHGQILPFHNIPKAVLIVAHQPRVDNDVLNTIDRGAAEQWPKRHLKNGDWDGGPTSKKAPRVRPVAVLLAAPSAGQQQLARALREQMREKYSDGTYALAQYCLGILPDAVHGSNQWDSLWLQRRQEPLEAIQAEPRKEIESIVECLRLLWLSGMQKRDTWRRYPGLNFRAGKFAPIPRW